jgi:hypothetical protein
MRSDRLLVKLLCGYFERAEGAREGREYGCAICLFVKSMVPNALGSLNLRKTSFELRKIRRSEAVC